MSEIGTKYGCRGNGPCGADLPQSVAGVKSKKRAGDTIAFRIPGFLSDTPGKRLLRLYPEYTFKIDSVIRLRFLSMVSRESIMFSENHFPI